MHDNPGATEREQELAQTERYDEEEEMRGGQSPDEDENEAEEE